MRLRASLSVGFTLIEILVALAIVAVALAAGMRALAQSADSASTLKARTIAIPAESSYGTALDFERFFGDGLPAVVVVAQPTGEAERYDALMRGKKETRR